MRKHSATVAAAMYEGAGVGYKEVGLIETRESAEAIARAFVDARRTGAPLPDYPGSVPQSLDEAYGIQACAIAMTDQNIAGWKVGRIPDGLVAAFGSDRLAGPIFAGSIVEAHSGEIPAMPMFPEGFGAAEAEYLLRLGALPGSFDREWTNGDVARFVDEIRVGIEVASSPFPGINDHGPAVTISDFGNNNGLVIGADIARGVEFHDWPVALAIDGVVAGRGTAAGMLDGPFGAVRFLFERSRDHGLALAAGQWISTGAITGVHPVRVGQAVEARFGDSYAVGCTLR
ncbi:MAG TPA: 2-keto-4-pentenoate hydratase [Sphingomonas sp.]